MPFEAAICYNHLTLLLNFAYETKGWALNYGYDCDAYGGYCETAKKENEDFEKKWTEVINKVSECAKLEYE